jgi:8-oxo-dGTP pyrophosphatase MutT (NUDIX family)
MTRMKQNDLEELATNAYVAHLIDRLAEHPPRVIEPEGVVRLAAILLVLRAGAGGEPELLMIKRADFEGDPWSGHIACPGGRMDTGDRDLAATAVRETWEETGIDVARDGRILGHLDDLRPFSKFLPPIIIRPYVGIVRRDVEIVPSPEVASAFWVPLSALREQGAWGMGLVSVHEGQRRVTQFQHGEHTVWGLTERALRQFLWYLGCPVEGGSVDETV